MEQHLKVSWMARQRLLSLYRARSSMFRYQVYADHTSVDAKAMN